MKWILTFLAITLLPDCSSAPINEWWIPVTYVKELRVRRPLYVPASGSAEPGGTDYESTIPPTETADCESPESLLKKINLHEVLACFNELQTKSSAANVKPGKFSFEYVMERKHDPELKLDTDETPPCLKRTLSVIPMPREIVFQAPEKDNSCFASRVDIEANEVMGVRLPTKKFKVRMAFPVETLFRTEADVSRYLIAFALTPFFDLDRPGHFKSKILTTRECKKCLSVPERNELYNPEKGEPPTYWPENR